MRKYVILLALALVAIAASAANVTVSAPVTSAVLYSNGFSYITRSGTAQLAGEDTTLHIINLTRSAFTSSISAADSAGAVSEIYGYDMSWNETKNTTELLSFAQILNKSLDSEIQFTVGTAAKTGKLVWYDTERIGVLANNAFSIYSISSITNLDSPVAQFNETHEENETKSEYGLAVREKNATAGGHNLRLNYLVSGATWTPNYKYYITSEAASGNGTLQGWAEVLNNAGEDWNGINLTLVVGYPRIARYTSYYDTYKSYAGAAESAAVPTPNAAPEFTYSPFSAYVIYRLSSPATIKDGETRELPLFERQGQEYKREYFWDTSNSAPEKIFILNNTSTTPRAAGIVSVYLNGELLGEESIGYTPRNQEMRVTVADLPDIHVKKESLNQTTSQDGNTRVTRYEYRLTVENTMNEDVDLRINDQMYYGDRVRLVSSTLPATIKPNSILEWNAHIAKGQKLEIGYIYEVTNYISPPY